MTILADVNPLYSGKLTGIGYFTDELLKQLALKSEIEGFAFNFRGLTKLETPYRVHEQRILPGKILSFPRYAKIDLPLSAFFRLGKADIILGTNYLLPPVGKIPNVVTVHDMCFMDHPEWVQGRNAKILKTMLPKTLERSNGLITISEFSASRIREVYGYKKPILVISIPPKKSTAEVKVPDALTNTAHKDFFLFISTIEPRKNIPTLLNAFETLPKNVQENHPLIIAGKPGWDEISLKRLRSKNNTYITYLEYVTEPERNWLYRNTLATIVPSLYEGFGMMTLESLNEGAPVIASNIPPQKEILGSTGLYFNPEDTKELTKHMLEITDKKYRDEVLAKQKKILKDYSWDKTTDQVLEFLRGFVKK